MLSHVVYPVSTLIFTLWGLNSLYDIVGHCPEIIPELRQEIKTTLRDHDNTLSTQALHQMKLLDSVMRETQRTNSLSVNNFRRHVLKSFTLSDGTYIPAGVAIAVPNREPANDPALYPEPERYNPYRFFNLRAGKTVDPLDYANKEQYQFISVTKENTAFGYGRHACPGRFLASNEIKLILARILLDYDIKLPPGVTGRYPNIVRGSSTSPDMTKEIMVRYIGE